MSEERRIKVGERVDISDLRVACPADMVHAVTLVLDGEYDLPVEDVCSVLDIGANVGAFALWATRRWPGCRVTGYEPQAVAEEAARKSAEANGVAERARFVKAAVVCDRRDLPEATLYLGENNLGEASTSGRWHRDPAKAVLVPAVHVDDLPACDILKVDTEGAEVAIVTSYLARHKPAGVAYEYHRRTDRDALETTMGMRGYELVGGVYHTTDTGVQRWVLGPRPR